MIRILVVDDHPIVRQGLVAVLEDEADFEVVGAAGSAEEALALVGAPAAGRGAARSGAAGHRAASRRSRACWRRSPSTRILVFTAYDTDERVLGAMRAGASGYLLKGAAVAEIAAAIRTVAGGGTALAPSAAARLADAVPGAARGRPADRPRARGLAADRGGLPGKQIAGSLGITERTVKFHTAALIRKLGADNRAQAVALAAQRGLLASHR